MGNLNEWLQIAHAFHMPEQGVTSNDSYIHHNKCHNYLQPSLQHVQQSIPYSPYLCNHCTPRRLNPKSSQTSIWNKPLPPGASPLLPSFSLGLVSVASLLHLGLHLCCQASHLGPASAETPPLLQSLPLRTSLFHMGLHPYMTA
ncbi:hypothetical protein Adt_32925 [Abeliophyllum distichum]|uniref:Uncharacterized protein n=1 Tax=Abeliophyllum distichum TaxID=126358 RepID=A0ABD1QUS4_9LAMI